jgi:hypothetical protein
MFDHFRWKRRVAGIAPLTPDAADGELRHTTGVVRAGESTLVAPASGRPCVAFAVHIHEPNQREATGSLGAGLGAFACVDVSAFAIECEQGILRVESQFAELHVAQERFKNDQLDGDRWLAFCEDKHASPRSTASEAIIAPGQRITLVGIVQRRPDRPRASELGYRDEAGAIWLVGDFDHPLQLGTPLDVE